MNRTIEQKWIKSLIFFAGSAFLFAVTFLQTVIAKGSSESLISEISETATYYSVPAVGISIIVDGSIQYCGAIGYNDKERTKPVNENTMFRVGSISKTIAGLAALKADELGILSLETEVSDVLGDGFLTNPWKQSSPVKVKHLLEHTAGLFDISEAEFAHDDPNGVSLQKALSEFPKSRVVHWPPGTHSSYSNLGAGIFARMLELRAGMSFERFVKEEVFTPLFMSNASYYMDEFTAQNLVDGHSSNGSSTIPYWHLIYRAFGALNVSPCEFSSLLSMLVNNGRTNDSVFMTGELMKRLRTPQSTLASDMGLEFGYGLGVYADESNGYMLFGHGGTAAGHLALYRYSPDLKLGYFVAINSNNSEALHAISEQVRNYILPKNSNRYVGDYSSVKDFKVQAGYYRHVTSRKEDALKLLNWIDQRYVDFSGERMSVSSLLGDKETLFHVKQGIFNQQDEAYPSAVLATRNGKTFIQTQSNNLEKISSLYYWANILALYCAIIFAVIALLMLVNHLVQLALNFSKKKANWTLLISNVPSILLLTSIGLAFSLEWLTFMHTIYIYILSGCFAFVVEIYRFHRFKLGLMKTKLARLGLLSHVYFSIKLGFILLV